MAQTEARPNMRKRWQDLFSGMKKKDTQVQLEQEAVEDGDGEAPVSKQIKAVQEKLAGAGEPTDATEQALGKPTEATKEDEVEMDQETPAVEGQTTSEEEPQAALPEEPLEADGGVPSERSEAAEEPPVAEAVVEEEAKSAVQDEPEAVEEQVHLDEPKPAEEAPAVVQAEAREVAAKFEALEVEYAQLSEQLETTESDKWAPMAQVQRNTLRKVMTVVADLQTELAETKACNEALEEDLQAAERICVAFVEQRQKVRGEAPAGCEAMPAGQEAKP